MCTALVIVICNSLTSGGFTQTTREILRYLKKPSRWRDRVPEETQVRLKLIADREDVEALEGNKALDKLRKADLAATGERNANANAKADTDADADAKHAEADARN
jgi:hypothetical protein